MEVDFGALRRTTVDEEALAAVYRRMEFKTFLQRMGQGAAPAATVKRDNPAKAAAEAALQPSLFDFIDGVEAAVSETVPSLETSGVEYSEITGSDEIGKMVGDAVASEKAGIALYATGEEAMTAQLRGIAVCAAEGRCSYVFNASFVRISSDHVS